MNRQLSVVKVETMAKI